MMRFNNIQTSLPGPILRSAEHNRIYTTGDFTASIEVNSSVNPHQINVKYKLNQDKIKKLLENKQVGLALAVNCPDTYFYEHIALSTKEEQTITIDETVFMGTVYFTLIMKAIKLIPKFEPDGLRPGFSGMEFNIQVGEMLAVSDEVVAHYMLPPSPPIGKSIFDLNQLDELKPNEFNISLTENKIAIGAGVKINTLIQQNMTTEEGKCKNLSAIYFPALIEVLYQVKTEKSDHDGKVWYEAIGKAMTGLGYDITTDGWQPLEVAQELLKSPYAELLGGKKK